MTLLIVVIVAIALYGVLSYNGMIKLRNRVKEAWSDIDVQLKRRYNLIPNIIETVKGYATHEEGVFTKVTEARAQAINATGIKGQGMAENMLSGALKSLFAVAESYPDLKANENFMQLQNELVDTEDKIQSARRFYNSVVKDFNTKIQQFPAKLIAQAFKFKDEEFFEVEDEEQKENVEVSFDKDKKPEEAESAPEPAVTEEVPAKGGEPETVEETPADTAEPSSDAVETEHATSPDETDDKTTDEPVAKEAPVEEEKSAEEPTPEPEAEAPSEEPTKEEEAPVEEEKAEEPTPKEPKEEPAEEEKAEEPTPDDTADTSGNAVETSHGASPDETDKETTPQTELADEPPTEETSTSEEPKEEKKEEDSQQAEMPLEEEEKKDA